MYLVYNKRIEKWRTRLTMTVMLAILAPIVSLRQSDNYIKKYRNK